MTVSGRLGVQLFAVLQHPFVDFRSFFGIESGRLLRPAWPLPNPGFEFVRSSGAVLERRGGGVKEWLGEECYTDGTNAFRFPNELRKVDLGASQFAAHATRTLRRFYTDGRVARLEVAAKLSVTSKAGPTCIIDSMALLRNYASLPIRVRTANASAKPTTLLAAGQLLAAHYLRATTRRSGNPPVTPELSWFRSGVPTIVVEFPASMSIEMPPHVDHVTDSADAAASLWHAGLQIGKHRASVWILRTQNAGDADALRRLRIHLLRFHAERECLRLVLQGVAAKMFDLKSQPLADELQRYLNEAIRLIEKPMRYGVDQSAIFSAAQDALALTFEGETATLAGMRRQVVAKIEEYLRRSQSPSTVNNYILGDQMNTNIQLGNVTVSGDFNLVTAKHIRNSFNKAAAAEVSAELKESLKTLTVEVTNLVKELPPEQAETTAKNLEALTDEATSQSPRKEWYELSAKGLLEAAKAVAEFAAPVTTAVNAVLALLL